MRELAGVVATWRVDRGSLDLFLNHDVRATFISNVARTSGASRSQLDFGGTAAMQLTLY
jgi:hypothetical protein